jgi:hypothetical protein
MSNPRNALNDLIGREGFVQLRAHELFASSPLLDVLTEKVSSMDPSNFCEQQLARHVRFLGEVLRETLARRYTGLSVLAFAHILVALDHVVRVGDEVPDTQVGGYTDDLIHINRVMKDWAEELNDFREWKLKMGERW